MTRMRVKQSKRRKYITPRPDIKGKTLYILYKLDMDNDELMSDGPFTSKDEAYNQMNTFLKKGICSWVVVYDG